MKVILLLCALIVPLVADTDEWKPKTVDEIRSIRSECLKEHPLTEEDMTKMKNFEYPDKESVRKYLLCTAMKMDVFCEHEGYHADRLAKQFKMQMDETEALAIAQGCIDKNEQKSTNDVWAFRGHKCLMSSKIGDKLREYIKKKQEETSH